MRVIKSVIGGLLLSGTLLLTACGGGVDVGVGIAGGNGAIGVNVQVPFAQFEEFDLIMLANGRQVPGVQVYPGEAQTVFLPVGQTFLIDSNGPVTWQVQVAGSAIVGVGNTISYGGATVSETLRTNLQIGGSTFASGLLVSQVPITYIATSVYNPE
ncbi:MAG: hypothetical protein WB821_13255, partial [Burkholderiaceae bacterium]